MVLDLIIKSIYFMLPAYFANMAPVIIKKRFKFLAVPIDFNKKISNKPILGKNKTWRGFIFGIIFAIIISFFQYLLYNTKFVSISLTNYSNWFVFGFLMGFGALTGDLVKSLIKRRLNIAPGQSFIPLDQMDFVFGALIFTYPLVKLGSKLIFTIIVLSFILDIVVNHIAFYLKFREEKW